MSKKQYKPQASSSRVSAGNVVPSFGSTLSSSFGGFGASSSPIAYLAEQPDLSTLSDPNIVVIFKNLSKKDATTKARGLTDLQNHFDAPHQHDVKVEDALLEAWAKVYPRTSIDLSRRVRQISHTLQGKIGQASGKQLAKYMPNIVGSWIAGTHDVDKAVSRAAREALSQVFSTPEKQSNLFKAYQNILVEYCIDAVLRQTPKTLSDERSTSHEDAETLYNRVVASSVSTISEMLQTIGDSDRQKQHEVYEEIISSGKVWHLVASKDVQVRRSALGLIRMFLERDPAWLVPHIQLICDSLLSKEALRRQAGTSLAYIESLNDLCACFPELWKRLQGQTAGTSSNLDAVVKNGSQGGPPQFWAGLTRLLRSIPPDVIQYDLSSACAFMGTMRSAINRKDEPRSNLEAAWTSYVDIAFILRDHIVRHDQDRFLISSIFPLFQQYMMPTEGESEWTLPSAKGYTLLVRLMENDQMTSILEEKWPSVTLQLVDKIKNLAEQHPPYDGNAQAKICQEAIRLFSLQRTLAEQQASEALFQVFVNCTEDIIRRVKTIILASKGELYGATSIIEAALASLGSFLWSRTDIEKILESFMLEDIPAMITSSSQSFLIAILYHAFNRPYFLQAWTTTLNAILQEPNLDAKNSGVRALMTVPTDVTTVDFATDNSELQSFLLQETYLNEATSNPRQVLVLGLKSSLISAQSLETLLRRYAEDLKDDNSIEIALDRIDLLIGADQDLSRVFLGSQEGISLLETLLRLQESADEVVNKAASKLNLKIQGDILQGKSSLQSASSIVRILHNNLFEVSTDSLAIETLVDLASNILEKTDGGLELFMRLVPNIERWESSLEPLLLVKPHLSLAICDHLGSAVFLVEEFPKEGIRLAEESFDSEGEGSSLRILRYVINLFNRFPRMKELDIDDQVRIYRLIVLTSQFIDDKLTFWESNSICSLQHKESEQDLLVILTEARRVITNWLKNGQLRTNNDGMTTSSETEKLRKMLFHNSHGIESSCFYEARAFAIINNETIDITSWKKSEDSRLDARLEELRQSSANFQLAAFLSGFSEILQQLPTSVKFVNKLVSDLTGLDAMKNRDNLLEKLVTLNIFLENRSEVRESIAKQRVVFLVQHITVWSNLDSLEMTIKAETYRLMRMLLPSISEIYGDHWRSIVDSLGELLRQDWNAVVKDSSSAGLPLIHASLKLMSCLRIMAIGDEVNEDFTEYWTACLPKLSDGLINLLKSTGGLSDDRSQPLKIINELLAREIRSSPPASIDGLAELYPLLQAKSHAVQETAFDILHRQIPRMQEQVSLDVALDKSEAELPDELLSLTIQTPIEGPQIVDAFERAIPSSLFGYLASWLLVFDHFKNSSDKVKQDYTLQIKEGDYLEGLLQFTFDFLGFSRSKLLDASKFDVTTYSFGIEDSPMRDTQWLLIHLYYLCLERVPSLAKSWWIDSRSRHMRSSVESWTAKHISPHIIQSAFSTVTLWAASQTKDVSEELLIKANTRTSEIVVSRDIDDQTLAIVIRLPSNFPLGQATVEGLNRVAVDRKRWQSWLLNAQGVIAFSNNSIIDGIISFRRNLAGRLKGQTECAICYSIVSQDKQLPTKKCGTCSNTFHGGCLWRWFKTSNSSSCPLCRTAFNYA